MQLETNLRSICQLSVIAFLCSCTAMSRSHGANQPARFSGYKARCEGNLVLGNFDGQLGGTRLSAPAGQHSLEVCFQSEPFWREDPKYSVDELCVDIVKYKVQLEARPALIYRFYVDGNPRGDRSLMVLESLEPGSVESKAIEAAVQKISSRQVCYQTVAPGACRDFTSRLCGY